VKVLGHYMVLQRVNRLLAKTYITHENPLGMGIRKMR
jgi:hypothetical protein